MAGQGPLEVEVDIAAPPDAVWGAVSDLKAMTRRSPELVAVWMVGAPGVGSRAVNINRRKGFFWPTTMRITQWKPAVLDTGRGALAFHVWPTDVTWSYEIEPTATGTRLIERRSAQPAPSPMVRLTARWALGGADGHDVELLAGMTKTLAAIKAELS